MREGEREERWHVQDPRDSMNLSENQTQSETETFVVEVIVSFSLSLTY